MNKIILIFVWIYNQIFQIWQVIYNYKYSFYILLILLILLGFASKVKNKVIATIIGILGVIVTLLLIGIFFTIGWNYLSDYQKEHPSTTSTQEAAPAPQTQENTPEIYGLEPELEDNYQYNDQTTKQLYYSASCNGCYAEGCPSNGYYYEGYDAGSYAYYYGLCQSCSCTSIVGHSFWK